MITFLTIIAIGFFLGMKHATDPDHVIAVTTVVDRESDLRRAALTGAAWGVGHTLTIFVVGSAVILLGVVIPGRVELGMELSVSLMLILLGFFSLKSYFKSLAQGSSIQIDDSRPRNCNDQGYQSSISPHSHQRDQEAHVHGDQRSDVASLDRGPETVQRHLRPFAVGIVHGLAGSAAVALLILTTIPDPVWGVAYLVVFGIGTISGMTIFTLSLTSVSIFAEKRFSGFSSWMPLAAGFLSVAFGMFMAYRLLWPVSLP